MQRKTIYKLGVDLGMTVLLLLLMAYVLTGQQVHEWLAAAILGIWAFYRQQIYLYLFLRTHFVFFDDSQPAISFFIEALAMLGLFAAVAYYGAQRLRSAHSAAHP